MRWWGLFFELTIDWPDELFTGYHVVLDTGPAVMVWWEQLASHGYDRAGIVASTSHRLP